MTRNTQLYETDYDAWMAEQIQALQQGRLEALDIPHLIEELEGLNKSNKREMYSYLVILLAHLLKWQYQPKERSGSWEASICNSRSGIERVVADQPSLKNYWQEVLPKAYKEAKKLAAKETKLNINLFPGECPYLVHQLMDEEWLPQ
jgi:hypothetical protein